MIHLAELILVCKINYWLPQLGCLRSIKQRYIAPHSILQSLPIGYRKLSVIHHNYFKIGSLFTMKEKCFQIMFCYIAEKQLMSHKFKLLCIMLHA